LFGEEGMINFRGTRFELAGAARPVAPEALRLVERQLKCTFPDDYRSFVTQFGAGEFEELCFKVLPPSTIAAETERDRSRLKEYWFWDESPEVWTQGQAVESIACFDGEGDDIRFHPSDPSKIYFMSHDEHVIYRCEGLAELLQLTRKYYDVHPGVLTFRPWNAERRFTEWRPGGAAWRFGSR
jgi:hypothetical protein